jgi:hypothetical protein
MGRQIKKTLEALYPYLGTEGWFISGSYANPEVNVYQDIDIFFTTKEYFDEAIKRTRERGRNIIQTGCSATVYHILPAYKVQYVCLRFGTPDEIFSTIDINVCRQGILPNGTRIQHPESKDSLRILIPSIQSFSRLRKYCQKYDLSKTQQTCVFKQCIDDYIDNDTYVHDYYEGKLSTYPLHYFLYSEFRHSNPEVVKYLTTQTLEHAPELLL